MNDHNLYKSISYSPKNINHNNNHFIKKFDNFSSKKDNIINRSIENDKQKSEITFPINLQTDMLVFKNEILRDLKILENRLVEKCTTSDNLIQDKLLNTNKEITSIKTKIKKLSANICENNVLNKKIDELIKNQNKSNDNILVNEIKLNSLEKESHDNIFKLGKIIKESVLYPGLIGHSCKFKNFHDFINYILNELAQFSMFREKTISDSNLNKVRVDGVIQNFKFKFENILNTANQFSLEMINKNEEKIKNIFIKYDEKIFEMTSNFEKNMNELSKKYTEFENKTIQDIERLKYDNTMNINNINRHIEEYLSLKSEMEKINNIINKKINRKNSMNNNLNDSNIKYISRKKKRGTTILSINKLNENTFFNNLKSSNNNTIDIDNEIKNVIKTGIKNDTKNELKKDIIYEIKTESSKKNDKRKNSFQTTDLREVINELNNSEEIKTNYNYNNKMNINDFSEEDEYKNNIKDENIEKFFKEEKITQKNIEIIRKGYKKYTAMTPPIKTENLLFNSKNINKNENTFNSSKNLNNIFEEKNKILNDDINNTNKNDIQQKNFNKTKSNNFLKTVNLKIETNNQKLYKSKNIENNILKEIKINSPKSANQEIKRKINKTINRVSSSHPFIINKKVLTFKSQNQNEQNNIYKYKEREIDNKKKNKMKILHSHKSENNLFKKSNMQFKVGMKWEEDLNGVLDYDKFKNIDFNGAMSIEHYEPKTINKMKLKTNLFLDEKEKNTEKEKYIKNTSEESPNKMVNIKMFKNPRILNAMAKFRNNIKFWDHDN